MFKYLWSRKFALLAIAILVALLPIAMTKEPITLSRTIATAIGIDYVDGEFVVHAEIVVFSFNPQDGRESELVTERGATVMEAFDKMGKDRGMTVSFTHCTIVIIGTGVLNSNETVAQIIRPIYKSEISNGAVLFYTKSDIQNIMQQSIESGNMRSGLLQQIAEWNRKHHKNKNTTIERFYKNNALGRDAFLILTELDTSDEPKIVNTNNHAIYRAGVIYANFL